MDWYDYQSHRLAPRAAATPQAPQPRPAPALSEASFADLRRARLADGDQAIEVEERSLSESIIERIPLLGKLRATFGK